LGYAIEKYRSSEKFAGDAIAEAGISVQPRLRSRRHDDPSEDQS
jgi:hypothetical protein